MVPMMVPKKFSGFTKFGVTPGGGLRAGTFDRSSFDKSIVSSYLEEDEEPLLLGRVLMPQTASMTEYWFGEFYSKRKIRLPIERSCIR